MWVVHSQVSAPKFPIVRANVVFVTQVNKVLAEPTADPPEKRCTALSGHAAFDIFYQILSSPCQC
jgi:hypothetical protein